MNHIRTTLITGGNSGIGEALARKLVESGQRVVSVGLQEPSWSHELLASYRADLTSIDEAREVARDICGRHAIDCLVHNAGMILPNLLVDAKPEDILTLAQLHLGAPMILTQAAMPLASEKLLDSLGVAADERSFKSLGTRIKAGVNLPPQPQLSLPTPQSNSTASM